MPGSKYGGIAVDEAPKSRYGGIAVEEPPAPVATSPTAKRNEGMGKPKTPQPGLPTEGFEGAMFTPLRGAGQVARGVQKLGQDGKRAQGASDIIRGVGKVLTPYLAPAMIANPVGTLTALGSGMVASPVAEKAAKLAGAEDDTAQLTGDVAGLGAGAAVGAIPELAAGVRGFARGAAENVPILGKWLKGAMDSAREAYAASKGAGAPAATGKPATAPSAAVPPAVASPATGPRLVPKPAPSGGAQPKEAPVPVADNSGVTAADLDVAARSLGAKSYSAVPDDQKAVVRSLAEKAKAPQPTKPQLVPRPAPIQSASSTVSTGESQPKAAPSSATSTPEPVAPPRSEADIARAAAQNLVSRGVTVDQLLAMPEADRAAALGDDAHRFGDIIREMRSHVSGGIMDTQRGAKDDAIAKFFKAKGISPEDVEAMDEGTLATHIKSAGYRIPGKSGALGRSHAQIGRDIAETMRSGNSPSTPPSVSTPSAPSGPTTPSPAESRSALSSPISPSNEVAKPGPSGIQAIVRTPAGTKANVRYKISEADDIKTSFDPDYNTAVGHQPRDTSRIGSRQRVEQRKADMDPEAMGASRMAGDGAPITKEGNAVTRNHGTQALKENYQANNAKAAEYRDWVQEQAGLAGMKPEDVAAMKNPIFHRELVDDWNHASTKKFADEANQSSVASMSDAEMAKQMGGKLSGATMDAFNPTDDGIPNPEFVRGLIRDLPAEEQAAFFDRNGEISQTGARLVRNAVFAKAYNNVAAIERMSEATDSQVRNITNGMLKAAAPAAKLNESIARGDSYPLAISDEVGKAVEVIDRLRTEKKTVSDWLKQGDLLGRDPVVHSLVDILAAESRRPNLIRDTLNNFVEGVVRLGSPKQQGIFGDVEQPSKLELLEDSYARAKADAASKAAGKGQPSLLGLDGGGAQ